MQSLCLEDINTEVFCTAPVNIIPIDVQEAGLGYFPALPLDCILSHTKTGTRILLKLISHKCVLARGYPWWCSGRRTDNSSSPAGGGQRERKVLPTYEYF